MKDFIVSVQLDGWLLEQHQSSQKSVASLLREVMTTKGNLYNAYQPP